MQQIYGRTPIPKCDFNKVSSNFIEIALRHGCSLVNLLHIFRTPFPQNTSRRLLLQLIRRMHILTELQHIKQNTKVFKKKVVIKEKMFLKLTFSKSYWKKDRSLATKSTKIDIIDIVQAICHYQLINLTGKES